MTSALPNEPTNGPKAAIYCRVSTDDQADSGTSLATQEAACRGWAADHGYTVPDGWVFRDDFTGYKKQRPALNALRARIAQGGVDALVCYDLSRLARRWRVQVVLMDEFDGEDVTLAFVQHKVPETLEDLLVQDVQGYTVEKHRNAIVEATERGLRERVRRGGMRVGRYPSYGLKYEDLPAPDAYGKAKPKWTYVLDDREGGEAVQVMRRIYRDLLAGQTLSGVAEALNREGVRTPAQYHWDMGLRSTRTPARPTGVWERGTIWSLVRNPVYKGERRSYSRHVEQYKSRQRDPVLGEKLDKRRAVPNTVAWDPRAGGSPLPGQYVVHSVPAVVDGPTWDAVQALLATNAEENNARNAIDPAVGDLKGRVYCGYCGHKMHRLRITRRDRGGRQEYHYVCAARASTHGRTCPGGQMRPDLGRLDRQVWDEYVLQRLVNPANLSQMLAVGEREQQTLTTRAEEQRARLDARVADIEAQLAQCMREVLHPEHSDTFRARWRVQAQDLERQLQELQEERQQVADAAAYTQGQLRDLKQMQALLERAATYFATLPTSERRHWLRVLDVRVRVWHPDGPGQACRWEADSKLERWQQLGLVDQPQDQPVGAAGVHAGHASANGTATSTVKNWVEYFYVTLEAE